MTQLSARSRVTPALCAQAGSLHIAWSDQQQQLHTMTSSDRGDHWGHKETLNETSGHGPAICEFNGDLYVAWTGTGGGAHLNVKSSRGEKVVLEDASAFGPALTVFNNRLFLAWVGVDPQHSLNIMSRAVGTVFENKVTLSQSSIGSPALQVAQAGASPSGGPGESLLLLAWTNQQGRLQIGGSSDGQLFQFGGPIEEETSFTGPALLTEQLDHSSASTVYISWTGTGTRHTINTMASVNPEKFSDGFRPSTKHTLNDSRSLAGPSLTGLFSGSESAFFMGYAREDDHHLEVITWP